MVLRFTDSNEFKEGRPWLYRIDEGDIVALELVYQGEVIAFFRSPASLTWYIAGEPGGSPDIPVFQQRWGGTPLLLSGPRVTRPLADSIENAASFGLDPPETAVTVFDRYGNTIEFHLGYHLMSFYSIDLTQSVHSQGKNYPTVKKSYSGGMTTIGVQVAF